MAGVGTLSSEEVDESDGSSGRRRRRRKSRGLSEKIKRSQQAAHMRKVITIVVLGSMVVIASIYVARNATSYDAVPELPPSAE